MRAALHDIGNLLTVITGFCELGKRDLSRGKVVEALRWYDQVHGVANDACDIIHKTFGTTPALRPGQFELNNIVRKIVSQTEAQLAGRGIQIRTDLWPEPLAIKGDEMDMQRAIFNLCLNARNAIARSGSIIVATKQHEPGRACVQVMDTGSGMSAEELETLWTRAPRGAHGHGLFIVKRTIDELGGEIAVASKPGSGTMFTLSVPVAGDGTIGA